MAVSFDLFGTLVSVTTPDDPAAAIDKALCERGVSVPPGFGDAYRRPHVEAPEGAETPLSAHVEAVLAARGVKTPNDVVRLAVLDAFDPEVKRLDGAKTAIEVATERGPVGLCSNCSVPGVVDRTLARTDLGGSFDAVVTSVGCGWRKPDPRVFGVVADRLGVETEAIVHVGDDPETDGGIEAVGGRFVRVDRTPLSALRGRLESEP